jgi:hypothetical protein
VVGHAQVPSEPHDGAAWHGSGLLGRVAGVGERSPRRASRPASVHSPLRALRVASRLRLRIGGGRGTGGW